MNGVRAGTPAHMLYWGKADPRAEPPCDWHPLPLHSLDVAAVASAYIAAHRTLLSFFASHLGLPLDLVHRWLIFLIGLHDLGKFASAFQGQRDDLLRRLQGRDAGLPYTQRHDTLGALLWSEVLMRRMDVLNLGTRVGISRNAMQPWIAAVTGHHGQPPAVCRFERVRHFKEVDEMAATAFVRDLRELLLPGDDLDRLLAVGSETLVLAGRRVSWWLAGATVLADWLGSNTRYFPYRAAPTTLRAYWDCAQLQAERALSETGVLPAPIAPAAGLSALFGWDTKPGRPRVPTPLQAWAESVQIEREPQLYLLEDVTGAGKTEAALVLAHRVMAAGQAEGVFMGLPTMATSNSMYQRVAAMAHRLYTHDTRPSLTLAHGQRGLVGAFRESIDDAGHMESDRAQADETATARCTAWLADGNKKALLANVGVGTIDQALLAVLHARHQSLRLLGLFRKVLIVDEVHACDAYMLRLLEGLLEFHAAAGGSAILLSATLPAVQKRKLAAAFARGAGFAAEPLVREEYPLATRIAAFSATEQSIDTRPEVKRSVAVDYITDPDEVEERILEAVHVGRCVCWIRNTVADAVVASQRFAGRVDDDKLLLFHARFALADRLAIENKVIARFGEMSGVEERAGGLVIATQVIEQSLDVDFDVVVSDLAPIDRLVQRAGRMQRHPRDKQGNRVEGPDARDAPRLLVFGPVWTETPSPDWYRRAFRGGAFVYEHVGQLWLTARLLQEGGFAMPEDGRRLVETVFGDGAADRIPDSLQPKSMAVEGKDWAATNLGDANRLKLATGYVRGDVGEWWHDEDAPALSGMDEWSGGAAATRLGEPTVTLRLARWDGCALTPWRSGVPHPWEASSLRLAARLVDGIEVEESMRSALEPALETLPDRGRWSILVPMRCEDGVGRFAATDRTGKRREWQYSSSRGLMESE